MIRKFPYLDEETREKVVNWLKSEQAECKATAFRYKAWNNEESYRNALYQASTFGSILLSVEYHMEESKE
jgi:hypothetical protein